jgi:hypothetical protein
VVKQVIQLRRGLDLLQQLPDGVRGNHVLGHDYGVMYAALLGAVDRPRVQQQVVIAADTTFDNWFVRFFLELPDDAVPADAAVPTSVDPIHYLARGPRRGTLLQYATRDFYVPDEVANLIADTAHPRGRRTTYDSDHEMALPEAVTDRAALLADSGTPSAMAVLPGIV